MLQIDVRMSTTRLVALPTNYTKLVHIWNGSGGAKATLFSLKLF